MTIDKETALLEILHNEWRLLIASVNTLMLLIENIEECRHFLQSRGWI